MHKTKLKIIKAALVVAVEKGYLKMTMADVAKAAEVVNGTVVMHFLNMDTLRRDLVRYAVDVGCQEVIAQAVLNKDRYVRKLSKELKQRAITHVINRA